MAQVRTAAQFAGDLLGIAATVAPAAIPVVKKAAQNIKVEAKENVQASAPTHHAYAHNAITYDDVSVVGVRVTTEVGYDKDLRGGALGNLLEYGGGGDRSPAHRDIGRAADNEEARFADGLQDMARRLL